jgi:hypothetical protein
LAIHWSCWSAMTPPNKITAANAGRVLRFQCRRACPGIAEFDR